MGLDLRVIAEERVAEIPDAMERAGFSVAVEQRTVDTSPERCRELGLQPPDEPVVITLIRCTRDKEQISLSLYRDDEQRDCRHVYIPNLFSWRPSRKRKRRQLHADVIAVLEDCGAYLPLPGGDHDSKGRGSFTESIKVIRNSASEPLRVWLEPWVEEVLIPPDSEFRFVGVGEQPGELQVEEADDRRIVYSWPTSRLTVYHGEEIVWTDFGLPVPPIPDGMSMSDFVDGMFQTRERRDE